MRAVDCAVHVANRPVHKSPSPTAVESWLRIMVSSVMLTVSRTMCFSGTPQGPGGGVRPDRADHADRGMAGVDR
jgi:hypothetical protein